MDTLRGKLVYHKHRTWAQPGSWPWGSAELWVEKDHTVTKENPYFMVVCIIDMTTRGLTIIRCPAPLLPSLVKVTAGTHEAADHGRNDGHKEEDGRRNSS